MWVWKWDDTIYNSGENDSFLIYLFNLLLCTKAAIS